jgi:hypothetical protein
LRRHVESFRKLVLGVISEHNFLQNIQIYYTNAQDVMYMDGTVEPSAN